jgi:hypothetical protein
MRRNLLLKPKGRDEFEIIPKLAVRVDDLRRALHRFALG